MIPKRYDKFGTVKILTVSRKQWYKNFENPSKFIFIVHLLLINKMVAHSEITTFKEWYVPNYLQQGSQHYSKT